MTQSKTNETLALDMRGIVKEFPGVLANDDVDFTLYQGEIHALLGENGAGKSTLMNVLSGLYRPEAGEIYLYGEKVDLHSPRDAIDAGIGMVHQHFMLVPTLSVAENVVLGDPSVNYIIHYEELEKRIGEIAEQFGLDIDPKAKIWQLSVGEQQRVEILKMLYQGAKILILDEPTAVLTPQEVTELFKTLREMTASGRSVIFISHKLDEVLEISDRITVLRRGKVSAEVVSAETTKAELAKTMVGREVVFRIEKKQSEPGDVVLEIDKINALNDRGLPALRDLSLSIRSGEVVGIAGVAGNGQTELAAVINGMRPAESGRILLNGVDITNKPATVSIDAGMAYIPADRTGVGSAPSLGVDDNIIMKAYRKPPLSHGWSLDLKEVARYAADLVKRFNVKTPSIKTQSRLLSGGNLQKMILARELSREPVAITAVYPSRGLDAGATEAVHERLIQERDRGAAILLISEDLDELLSLSDRIAVIYEGKIVGEVPPDDSRIEGIGLLMAGTVVEEAV